MKSFSRQLKSKGIHDTSRLLHKRGGFIKAVGVDEGTNKGLIEGYLISWGNERDADLQGEWFTKDTDFCLDWFKTRPVLYHHGLDGQMSLKSIGDIVAIKKDDLGLWVQAQIDLSDRYNRAIYEMVKTQTFGGWSSGSVDHLVEVADSGEIKRWPIIEGSITPTPAQPSKVTIRVIKTLLRTAYIENLARNRREETREATTDEVDDNLFRRLGENKMGTLKSRQKIMTSAKSLGIKLSRKELNEMSTELDNALASDELEDDALMADDLEDDAVMMDEFEDDALAADDFEDDATLADEFEDDATLADEFEDDALMADDFEDDTLMADDLEDDTLMADEFEDDLISSSKAAKRRKAKTRKSRKARRKSINTSAADYWKRRAMKAELAEAPRQRQPSMKVKDVADREGAYEWAFKTMLQHGEARAFANQNVSYILNAKGRVDYGPAEMRFDRAGKSVKTYNIGSDASWGFAVPETWINTLNKNIMTQANMANDCRTVTTASDHVIQPNLVTTDARRSHAASVSWPGELPTGASDSAATEDVLSQINIPVHVMLINHTASLSSMEDSAFDLQAEINEAFVEAVSISYEQLIWAGDGQGKLMGIVNDPLVNASASAGVATVGGYIPTGSTLGFINGDVIKRMAFHMPAGYRSRAKWYMNSDTALEISLLKDGVGNYLIDPRDEALRTAGVPDRLFRYPIVYNEFASGIASGNYPIVLAALNPAYTIAKRVDFSVRRFDDSAYAVKDQCLILGRARIGGQVTQPAAVKLLKVSVS